MQWLKRADRIQVLPAVLIPLLHQAIEKNPSNLMARTDLGHALETEGDYTAAARSFESAAKGDPEAFDAWANLASCYLKLNDLDAALDVCRRADRHAPGADIHIQHARTLQRRGQSEAARDALMRAVHLGDPEFIALTILFKPLAKEDDGAKLLDFCDALPAQFQDSVIVRAHRAIGLSRLGRSADAGALVDVQRDVEHSFIEVPPGYVALEEFNRVLAEEILAQRVPDRTYRAGFNINYRHDIQKSPALQALCTLVIAAMDDYIAARNTHAYAIATPPERGYLGGTTVVLRGDGRNGEHVHRLGYVSSVYYVSVPETGDVRGALALGQCTDYTAGHTPSWGIRHIEPVAGLLVTFPSQLFHDVVPTGVDRLRISVALDLLPLSATFTGWSW